MRSKPKARIPKFSTFTRRIAEALLEVDERWLHLASGVCMQDVFALRNSSRILHRLFHDLPSRTFSRLLGCSILTGFPQEHDVIELFNKRHFRCDCGTKRFEGCGQSSCSLYTADTTESVENSENVYNHNFFGRYCICDKEYQEDSDTMFQCLRCQDWFHDKCVALVCDVPHRPSTSDRPTLCRRVQRTATIGVSSARTV